MIQLELPLQQTTVIEGKDKILQYRLLVIRSGVRLEGLGMKKRGKSYTAIAKEMLGYSRFTKRKEVLQALDALIDVYKN
jgi:hypothetical protein